MNNIQRNYIYHYFDKNIKNNEDIPNNMPNDNEYIEDIHIFNNLKEFNNTMYNYRYTKNIIKDYVKNDKLLNQQIYNYFFGGIINLSCRLLINPYEINNRIIKIERSDKMKQLNRLFRDVNDNISRKCLLYIFFYMIPKTRSMIEIIKTRNLSNRFGFLYGYKYCNISDFTHDHSFNMDRFVDYNRLDKILNNIKNLSENIAYYDELTIDDLRNYGFITEKIQKSYDKKYDKNCFDNNYNISSIQFKKYTIRLDIPLDFFSKNKSLIDSYRILQETSELKIKFYTYNNKVKRLVYGIKNPSHNKRITKIHNISLAGFFNLIGNTQEIYYNNVTTILNILTYCLILLRHKINIEKKKEIITVFYYLMIYYMPFSLGTSSISEMSLYTLWNTYININGFEPLYINKNTMIDIEALSLPYTEFYHNCFNKTIRDIYTPYFLNDEQFIEQKINILRQEISTFKINYDNNDSLSYKEDKIREINQLKILLKNIKSIKKKIFKLKKKT